jgi:hypothetical protein
MSRDLAALQLELAALIRTGRTTSSDPYVQETARSTGLAVLRDCITEWRELVLRQAAPLTASVLDRKGELRDAVRELLERECPPFTEDLALAFLDQVRERCNPFLGTIAEFEAAMIRSHHGAGEEVMVRWPVDPEETMLRILGGESLDGIPPGDYVTVIKPDVELTTG